MRKYIIFANLFLVIAVIFLGMKSYDRAKELSQRKKINTPIKHSNREYTKARKYSRNSLLAGASHSVNYYNVIPEKDLFRPERKEYKEEPLSNKKKEVEIKKKDIQPPAVDLYGIMIDKKKSVALVYDKREKEQNLRYKVVSTGDEIQGYKVIRIQAEQIIVEKAGRMATIPLSHAKSARGGIMDTEEKVTKIIKKTEPTGKSVTMPKEARKLVPDKIPQKQKAPTFETKKKENTKPAITKKDIPMGVPFIVQKGNKKYRIIKTPVGEKKITIN